jgi:glycosyltransferase involved in cell wall biosynthesis
MKVSVIIPTYNRPGYLAQAVYSVLQQTHAVHEIIIVNDGSLPQFHPKIEALKELDDRIQIFHFPENKGASVARNYGLERSAGDYVLFLDDDDLLRPGMVESNLKVFNRDGNADVVSSGYELFYDETPADSEWDGAPQQSIFPTTILYSWNYGDSSLLENQPFSALLRKNIQVSSCLIRKKVLGSIRFPEELTRGEDVFFWLMLASTRCRFKINNESCGFYRLHFGNSESLAGWRQESLKMYLKLVQHQLVIRKRDWLLIHLRLAYKSSPFNLQKSCYHVLKFLLLLLSPSIIPLWPQLLNTALHKVYSRWKFRKIERVYRIIHRQRIS